MNAGATSQKTTFFIVTAVKTSNLTSCSCMGRLHIYTFDYSRRYKPRRLSYSIPFLSFLDAGTIAPSLVSFNLYPED
jgi:hypothetical protein